MVLSVLSLRENPVDWGDMQGGKMARVRHNIHIVLIVKFVEQLF